LSGPAAHAVQRIMRPFFHHHIIGCLTKHGGGDLRNLSATFSSLKAACVHTLWDAPASKVVSNIIGRHPGCPPVHPAGYASACINTVPPPHCLVYCRSAVHDAGPSWHVNPVGRGHVNPFSKEWIWLMCRQLAACSCATSPSCVTSFSANSLPD
jgi:hypothetical protein